MVKFFRVYIFCASILGIVVVGFFIIKTLSPYLPPKSLPKVSQRAGLTCFGWFTTVARGVESGEAQSGKQVFVRHKVYRLDSGWALPPYFCLIAVGSNLDYFVLPRQFNAVMQQEGVEVNNSESVLDVVRKYLAITTTFGDVLILRQASDIPEVKEFERRELSTVIQPPKVDQVAGNWQVTVYSYARLGGVVKLWKLQIDRIGVIQIESERMIKNGVGESFGLL